MAPRSAAASVVAGDQHSSTATVQSSAVEIAASAAALLVMHHTILSCTACVDRALSLDNRNFHAWNYRQFIVKLLRVPTDSELGVQQQPHRHGLQQLLSMALQDDALPKLYNEDIQTGTGICISTQDCFHSSRLGIAFIASVYTLLSASYAVEWGHVQLQGQGGHLAMCVGKCVRSCRRQGFVRQGFVRQGFGRRVCWSMRV